MVHSLLHVRDSPTLRRVNAVMICPQKDIVSHKRLKFPVLKNSRPRKWFIYGCVFSKPPWSSYTDFKKKISFDTVVQMLGKAMSVMRQVQRSYKWPSCPFSFQAFCYVKLQVIPLAGLVHTVFLSVHTEMFFQLIELYCNAFSGVEVLKKAEPKLGHILRISFEIIRITFINFRDPIKIIWLLLSLELSSFSTVCRRGQ